MNEPRRGRRRRDPVGTRAAILQAARRQFTEYGYQPTTVRGIAAEAGIDPTMVIRYFGSKEDLFATAVTVDLELPDFTALPPAELGSTIVRTFLRRWEVDLAGDALGMILRSAPTHPAAAARLREIFAAQVRPAIAAVAPDHPGERAALVSTQLLGLALCRYVLELEPLAATDPDVLVARIAETIQRYVTGPII